MIGIFALLAALLTLGGAWALFPKKTFSAADLLPAKQTVALLEHVDRTNAEPFISLVPALTQLPLGDEKMTVALVQQEEGQTFWVIFRASGEEKIVSSNPAILDLLGSGPSLSNDPLFRSMRRLMSPDSPWGFLQRSILPSNEFAGMEAIALSSTKDRWMIAFPAGNRPGSATWPEPLGNNGSGNIVHLQTRDSIYLANTLSALTEENTEMIQKTMLAQWAHDAFGTDISLRYDMFSALTGPFAFLRDDEAGTWIMRGEMQKNRLPDIINALHASFRGTIGATSRLQRTFDERFPLDVLMINPETAEERSTKTLGWTVRTTNGTGNERGLTTAVRGTELLIGNDANLVDAALRRTTISSTPATPATVSQGKIPRSLLLADPLKSLVPPLLFPTLSRGTGSTVFWRLEHQGDLSVLTIR